MIEIESRNMLYLKSMLITSNRGNYGRRQVNVGIQECQDTRFPENER